jgi:hypothetical protein
MKFYIIFFCLAGNALVSVLYTLFDNVSKESFVRTPELFEDPVL